MRSLLTVCLSGLVTCAGVPSLCAQPAAPAEARGYEALKARAEAFFAEGSFQKCNEVYAEASPLELPPADARWVRFRLADTLWRSQAATETADDTPYERARRELEALAGEVQRPEDRDQVWAEVQESLGDYCWRSPRSRDWQSGWQHYQGALEWWGWSADLATARVRYLAIVRKAVQPPGQEDWGDYWWYAQVPVNVLDNALKVSETPDDIAFAHFVLAMALRHHSTFAAQQRVPVEFEGALQAGKSTAWYDDALYAYAEWLASRGPAKPAKAGGFTNEPDYVQALGLFQRLTSEFKEGESQYWPRARDFSEQITAPNVYVSVGTAFLPDSLIQFDAGWRNVSEVTFNLYQVTLIEDADFTNKDAGEHGITVGGRPKLKTWTRAIEDKGDHRPGRDAITLAEPLPPGAYMIEIAAAHHSARALILVTDATLVLKTSGRQALAYVCNSYDGAPLAGASVLLWEYYDHDGQRQARSVRGTTDENGLVRLDLQFRDDWRNIYAAILAGDRQAFASTYASRHGQAEPKWRIYAFTDRPAYRPGDTLKWKLTARLYAAGQYSTPAGKQLKCVFEDGQGARLKEVQIELNAFGSAWGELPVTEKMALGEVSIRLLDGNKEIGAAELCRFEEYKLPEFKVTVETPKDEQGRPKVFRVGDRVEATLQAEYYFGGAVTNADVTVRIHQSPFQHSWSSPHDYPWFYEDPWEFRRWYRDDEQVIKEDKLKTDATGKATVVFETPANAERDFEYRIEARVADASRREIEAEGVVRVTRQKYYVYLTPAHNIYRPADKVVVEVRALDASQNPIPASGEIAVSRQRYVEIWLDPRNQEVRGDELQALIAGNRGCWPPVLKPGEAPWRLKFRGYEQDDIFTQPVQTDAEGRAEFTFQPERDGYYKVAWRSEDPGYDYIRAESFVWIATDATHQTGFRPGGVEIVIDKDTFRAGQTAAVMLTVPTNDRYVLFTVSAEDLLSYQLVHVTGNAKLLQLPITGQYVPNIYLGAVLVSGHQLFQDQKEVVVPPVEHFLTVEVQPDREIYEPQQEGTLTVRTKDCDGKPVAAEVALSLADESVFYIQQDLAGDPQPFFFGQKRDSGVRLAATAAQLAYRRLVHGPDGKVLDERALATPQPGEPAARMNQQAQYGFDVTQGLGDISSDWGMFGEGGGAGAGMFGQGEGSGGWARRGVYFAEMPAASERTLSLVSLGEPMTPALLRVPSSTEEQDGDGGIDYVPAASIQVRSDFRATAFWQPDVKTDADGVATVKVKYPDSVTAWQATARAATTGSQFGMATGKSRTRQPLIVRVQAPRFFLVGDTVTVSAVLNNNTDAPLKALPGLKAEGLSLEGWLRDGQLAAGEPAAVEVPAHGEQRVDWRIRVEQPGTAKLTALARGEKHADAMERSLPIFAHGIEQLVAKSGKVREGDVTVKLAIPAERQPDTTTLTVQVAPSLAVTMLDALPYLVDYPYGCTEQTMSRFLPAVITAKTLGDLGLSREIVANRLFGGMEHPASQPSDPNAEPSRGASLARLDEVVNQCLARLYDFQHADGGWSWWKGDATTPSDHFMTAYVVWGLALARDAGITVEDNVLKRAVAFLETKLVEEENAPDMQAWMLHALAVYDALSKTERGASQQRAYANILKQREKLNAYTRALLALCAHAFGKTDDARLLVRNFENGVQIDDRPDTSVIMEGVQQSHDAVLATAHWGADGVYYHWSEGGEEATAFMLRALLAIEPDHKLVEPVTNWLIKNRRGAQWRSTRDTAIVVLALNDYLRRSGELKPDVAYEVLVNGQSVAQQKVTPADVFAAPSRFVVDPKLIRDGDNEIRIRRTGGTSPLYFAAEARFVSLECPLQPTGNEIFVRRQYYRLAEKPTLLQGLVYQRVPLNDGDKIISGERVESVITLEAKNNYEYLVFEDLKPAGFEAVQVRSGEPCYAQELKSGIVERQFGTQTTAQRAAEEHLRRGATDHTGRSRWTHQELRDRKVAFFLDQLLEGVWELRYELRAEVPGEFHALPTIGYAMYVPELRCNGTEIRVQVDEP